MPIYVYQPNGDTRCDFCSAGFEKLEKLTEPRLSTCPHCAAPCKQVITAPNLHAGMSSLKPKNLAEKGFTQYRKVSKGVYEKSAGKGPQYISDDGKD